jgi:hypothetical protein
LVTGSPTTVHIEIVLVLKKKLQLILPTTTAEYDYSIICMKDLKKKKEETMVILKC